MQKLISIGLTAVLCVSSITGYAIDTTALQASLLRVKALVDIPATLTEFSSNLNNDNGYDFSWSNEDDNEFLSITTDADGHIGCYYYSPKYFADVTNAIYCYSRADLITKADAFISSIAPELFENETDHLVPDASNYSATVSPWMTLSYHREYMGVTVEENFANVVFHQNNDIYIAEAFINWDYSASLTYPANLIQNPEDAFYATSPIALEYVDKYDTDSNSFTQCLAYSFIDAKCIDATTGEACERCYKVMYANSTSAMKEEAVADSAGGLSPAELKELQSINGLVDVNTIVSAVNKMGVFKPIPSDAELTYSTYQDEDKSFYYTINISKNDDGWWLTANAQTGALISLNSYSNTDSKASKYNEVAVQAMIDGFLSKYYPTQYNTKSEPTIATDEDGYSYSAYRLINGIPYRAQTIYLHYDAHSKKITSFNIDFNDAHKDFPAPDGILSADEALDIVKTTNPLELRYICTDEGVYTLCYIVDGIDNIYKDAFTGEELYSFEHNTLEYTDISGHWAEDIILKLAELGRGFEGSEFRPDDYITIGDFKALLSGFDYSWRYYSSKFNDDEDEGDLITREDAFYRLCGQMGYGKISTLNQIFKTDFADSISISPERVGALAILQGLGIITGDISGVRPHDNLTRAEAATLVYRFLLNN